MAKGGADTPVAVGLELVADRLHPGDDRGLVGRVGRRVIEGRSGQPHQQTSLCDGDPLVVEAIKRRVEAAAVPCEPSWIEEMMADRFDPPTTEPEEN